MSKPFKQRQVDAIHQGRPQKLQRIGNADPGKKSDRRQGGVFITQPVAESIADQEKGKARRKPKQQHRQRFGSQVVGDLVLVRTHAFIVYRSLTKLNLCCFRRRTLVEINPPTLGSLRVTEILSETALAGQPTVSQHPGCALAAVAAEFRRQLAHHSVSQKG